MSTINIIKNYNLSNVCLIFVHKNMENYYIQTKNMINASVYVLKELYDIESEKLRSPYIRALQILKKKKYVRKNKIFQSFIEELYVPSDDMNCRIIYYELKKHNSLIKLNLIDDGLGTYLEGIFEKKKILSRMFYLCFLNYKYYEKINEMYIYHPEFIDLKSNNIKLKKIKVYSDFSLLTENLIEKHLKIYEGKKILFLDQGINNEIINTSLKMLLKIFDRNEILIKKHPRIISNFDYSEYEVVDDGLPIEVIFSNYDCNNCVIVSHSSTGCITPYLMYDIFIYPIMLYKITKDNLNEINNIDKFINKINKLNNNIIKTPDSLKEYYLLLEDLNESGKIKSIRKR